VVVNRVSNGKGQLPEEEYVRKQIYKLQQPLGYQTADESHDECERGGHHDRRLQGLPKFPKPPGARHALRLCFNHQM
jgi:hypothetical protein